MVAASDLAAQVSAIFSESWSHRDGRKVPVPEDLRLDNDSVRFDRATILYADLSGSTKLVDTEDWTFAAEIYKTYLHCAAAIIRAEGGAITSYDGDRVMGMFIGDYQSTPAARTALKINYAVRNIVNPALLKQYPHTAFRVRQVVGIDTSPIHAARTGVRGDNDIVWVGRAANYAAKLTELKLAERSWLTKAAYDRLHHSAKTSGTDGRPMWKPYNWAQMDGQTIYGSAWTWKI